MRNDGGRECRGQGDLRLQGDRATFGDDRRRVGHRAAVADVQVPLGRLVDREHDHAGWYRDEAVSRPITSRDSRLGDGEEH